MPTLKQARNKLIRARAVSEALEILSGRVHLRPRDPAAIYDLAMALEQLDRVPQAIQGFQRALHLGLGELFAAIAHASLGQLWLVSCHPQAALEELETALKMQPDLLEARINRALVLAALGRLQRPSMEIQRLQAGKPDDRRILQVARYIQAWPGRM